jgi:hypothetical protein
MGGVLRNGEVIPVGNWCKPNPWRRLLSVFPLAGVLIAAPLVPPVGLSTGCEPLAVATGSADAACVCRMRRELDGALPGAGGSMGRREGGEPRRRLAAALNGLSVAAMPAVVAPVPAVLPAVGVVPRPAAAAARAAVMLLRVGSRGSRLPVVVAGGDVTIRSVWMETLL